MFKRMLTGSLFVLLVAALLNQPLSAGGWAVVTLDELPIKTQAGEPVALSFQIQQHGIRPAVLPAGEVIIRAKRLNSDEAIEVVAVATGSPGHYTAQITFPAAGLWSWAVQPGGFPTADMPDLTVTAAPIQPTGVRQSALREWEGWRQVLFQMMAAMHRPSRPASLSSAANATMDQAAYGRALFVAKGCATCHHHGQVSTQFSTQAGPELTHYTVIPEYVKVWLSDPAAIKPATLMPNLHLTEQEIDALVAFLSSVQEQAKQ